MLLKNIFVVAETYVHITIHHFNLVFLIQNYRIILLPQVIIILALKSSNKQTQQSQRLLCNNQHDSLSRADVLLKKIKR